jgi:Tfp pilus assembly protein FimT
MLVLAIIALLTAMAYPVIETMYGDVRVSAAADNLRGRFAEARSRAIEEQRPYRFAVKANTGDYRLAPDSADNWGEANAQQQQQTQDDSAPAPLVVEDTLPSDILFQFGSGAAGMGDSGGWTPVVTFQPDGSCSEDRVIRLERDGSRAIEITIRALTSSITARSVRPGGQ